MGDFRFTRTVTLLAEYVGHYLFAAIPIAGSANARDNPSGAPTGGAFDGDCSLDRAGPSAPVARRHFWLYKRLAIERHNRPLKA